MTRLYRRSFFIMLNTGCKTTKCIKSTGQNHENAEFEKMVYFLSRKVYHVYSMKHWIHIDVNQKPGPPADRGKQKMEVFA